jgi:hypothetical protein
MTVDIMIRLCLSNTVKDINLFWCYESQINIVGLCYTIRYGKYFAIVYNMSAGNITLSFYLTFDVYMEIKY